MQNEYVSISEIPAFPGIPGNSSTRDCIHVSSCFNTTLLQNGHVRELKRNGCMRMSVSVKETDSVVCRFRGDSRNAASTCSWKFPLQFMPLRVNWSFVGVTMIRWCVWEWWFDPIRKFRKARVGKVRKWKMFLVLWKVSS